MNIFKLPTNGNQAIASTVVTVTEESTDSETEGSGENSGSGEKNGSNDDDAAGGSGSGEDQASGNAPDAVPAGSTGEQAGTGQNGSERAASSSGILARIGADQFLPWALGGLLLVGLGAAAWWRGQHSPQGRHFSSTRRG